MTFSTNVYGRPIEEPVVSYLATDGDESLYETASIKLVVSCAIAT